MPTQAINMISHRPSFNLIAEIVSGAVKDFNEGDESERTDAALFFRSEDDFGWMLKAVNGTMDRFIKARLCESPFKVGRFKSRKHKMKADNPGKKIKWNGLEMTVAGWAGEIGVDLHTFRARLSKKGVCAEVFEV